MSGGTSIRRIFTGKNVKIVVVWLFIDGKKKLVYISLDSVLTSLAVLVRIANQFVEIRKKKIHGLWDSAFGGGSSSRCKEGGIGLVLDWGE